MSPKNQTLGGTGPPCESCSCCLSYLWLIVFSVNMSTREPALPYTCLQCFPPHLHYIRKLLQYTPLLHYIAIHIQYIPYTCYSKGMVTTNILLSLYSLTCHPFASFILFLCNILLWFLLFSLTDLFSSSVHHAPCTPFLSFPIPDYFLSYYDH